MARDGAPTLLMRVARVAVITAIVGAVAAATTAGFLAERLIQAQEDARLRDAARTLAGEIAETPSRGAALADEEMREIAHTGIRIALFVGTGRIGGDATVEYAEVGCNSVAGRRACALTLDDDRRIVVTSGSDPRLAFRRSFWSAAAIAVLLAALVGVALSLRLSRWAIAPLRQLEAVVQRAGADPAAVAMLVPAMDCREVDAVREALRDALRRLDTTLSRARRFSADAAHELRTPLTTALAEIELAAETAPVDLGRAQKTLTEVSRLLDRLLLLSAPPERVELREAVSLAELAEEIRTGKPERVVLDAEDDGIVRGDPTLLRVLIENIVDNALKFSRDEVVIAIRDDPTHVRLRVSDRGPGVLVADRERVFDAFFRSAESRANSTEGSGIGLALVAHIAALHGGRAMFLPVERGACLEVELPAWAPA